MSTKVYLFKKQQNFNPTIICASTVYLFTLLVIYLSSWLIDNVQVVKMISTCINFLTPFQYQFYPLVVWCDTYPGKYLSEVMKFT